MGLTSALYSTLTGLNANQQRLDVIGNNIANTNTVGFKSSQMNFETLFAQTISNGAGPSSTDGGTNPFQVGLGTKEGAVTTNFTSGSQQVTGVNTDLAIQGDGFFTVKGDSGQEFTRDGSFNLDSANELVTANGDRVQGYSVDSNFNIVQGPLSNISIPLGSLTIAQATTAASFDGSLNGEGTVASTITQVSSSTPLFLAGTGGTPSSTAPAGTDLLTNLVDSTNTPYFQNGDAVTVTEQEGSTTTAGRTLTVTGTTTVQDYLNFIGGTLGLDTNAGANGTLPDAGATLQAVSPATSTFPANSMQLVINGNRGTANNFAMSSSSVSIVRAGTTSHPFSFDTTPAADGESAVAPTTVFDSLGSKLDMNVAMTLVSRGSAGTTWQFIVTSPDSTTGSATGGVGTQTFIADGTLTFDNNGRLVNSSTPTATIDRSGTGANPSLQIALSFDNITALASSGSVMNPDQVDGAAKGVLNSFAIQNDGTITGSFDNGQTRTLGQVVLATFRNNQGLVQQGNNAFTPGANSGLPVFSAPGTSSAGTLIAGALELSNVDLSTEFVNLISASTGFSASSRIITTSNQLLQDLLQSTR